jgi:hypothetical protein
MHGRTEQHTVAQAPVLARAHSALSSTPTTFDPTAKYKNRLELFPLICSAPSPPNSSATSHQSWIAPSLCDRRRDGVVPSPRHRDANATAGCSIGDDDVETGAAAGWASSAANHEDEAAKAGKRLPFDCGRAPPACSVLGAPSAAVDRVVGDRGWRVGTGRQRETGRAGAPAVV